MAEMQVNVLFWVTIFTKDKKGGYIVPPDLADELMRRGTVIRDVDDTLIMVEAS